MTTEAATGTRGLAPVAARGIAAGLAGTVVMTAFQRFVEMPITGRPQSYAPADFAQRVLPIRPSSDRGRSTLNWATHFGVGGLWGVAHGLVERAGLRGQRAVAATFGVVYTADTLLNTALGLYQPWRWSARDWAIDLGDKLVLAEATGLIYERLQPTQS